MPWNNSSTMDARERSSSTAGITEVYRDNFKEEERRLLLALSRYNTVAFDTEYPGAINQTPQFADDEKRYRDLKSNVERTKLIQIGFAVFDSATSELAGVWQFNFSGFSPRFHDHEPSSIRMLERCGIDFGENLRRGVRMTQFTRLLKRIRDDYAGKIQWITFHGLYDVAYLLAALSGGWTLPPNILGFAEAARELFLGGIFDLKMMAGPYSWMGLEKLAAAMGAEREGQAHQAGSDSLLTARIFAKAVQSYNFDGNWLLVYNGLLFGIRTSILSSPLDLGSYYHFPPLANGSYLVQS